MSSFLPLVEERSGAKFLIQADFLVNPGREAIQYELSWNHWLVGEAVEAAKQAIEKFKADARPGTFGNATKSEKIDYVLLSPALNVLRNEGALSGVVSSPNSTLTPLINSL